jgi:NAD(P)-dependent dehydrogenase (short-subunit alcohol dehydrogenase family)
MQTIIITGANGNLGAGAVKTFLEKGYTVIAVDNASDNLSFAAGNPNFDLHAVNLTNEGETTDFIERAIQKYSTISGALLLVGGFAMGGIDSVTGTDMAKMYSLNFETAFFISRPLFKHMREKGYGRLVFIGARPALKAEQGKSLMAYSLSKSLLFKFAELLNEESRDSNVVATVVVPSTIDTELNRKSMPGADASKWVKAEQLAEVMEFITSGKGNMLRETVLKVYNNS